MAVKPGICAVIRRHRIPRNVRIEREHLLEGIHGTEQSQGAEEYVGVQRQSKRDIVHRYTNRPYHQSRMIHEFCALHIPIDANCGIGYSLFNTMI